MKREIIKKTAKFLLSGMSAEETVNAVPKDLWAQVVAGIAQNDKNAILQGFGPFLNRKYDLSNMPVDLPLAPEQDFGFEHLAGMFSSTSLDHSVVSMTVRQVAYLFGLARSMKAKKVIEVGRYKGGATLALAMAMKGQGDLWSIDIGEKEARLKRSGESLSYDQQLQRKLGQCGCSNVHLIVGDSRTVEVDTGNVDLVFIDGDHSYEGVRNDFERFGRRVRKGGAVLFDDACGDGVFKSHDDTVGRLVGEVVEGNEFILVKHVNRLAHIERVR